MVDESKQRATDLLYKIIDVYNEQWLKDRNRVAISTSEFITERLDNLSKELGDVDQKISDYKSQAMLPDVDAASSMYMSQMELFLNPPLFVILENLRTLFLAVALKPFSVA